MTPERSVTIPASGGADVAGDLTVPDAAVGLVVFAHGSGSGRHSGRNRHVARLLQDRGLATLLIDLLTEEEEVVDRRTAELRFDIDLLAGRLVDATRWATADRDVAPLAVGYFGASTGGGAAIVAAAALGDAVAAVVSRGGRPDLAGDALAEVRAPTLLVVGGRDEQVLDLNRRAAARLSAPWHLEVVPGATHLFEEPGALDAVAGLAGAWFGEHLVTAGAARERR